MHESWRKIAIGLRHKGYSYNLIKEKIPVSKSTLSYWLSGIPFTPNELVKKRVNAAFLQSSLTRNQHLVDFMKSIKQETMNSLSSFSDRDMLLFGLGLYIGEGAKLSQRVRIINSDPRIIQFSVLWLEKIFNVPKKHFSLTIHLYPDCDIQMSLNYWSNLTKIPLQQFRKTQIDLRKNKSSKKHRILPYGTANLEVNGYGNKKFGSQLFRRVITFIDVVFEKSGIIVQQER